ncbi:hypothetical protein ACLOJK_038897, partial [Asimina triloba]
HKDIVVDFEDLVCCVDALKDSQLKEATKWKQSHIAMRDEICGLKEEALRDLDAKIMWPIILLIICIINAAWCTLVTGKPIGFFDFLHTPEIPLQLDIAIGAVDSSKSEEFDIPCVKRLKVTEEPSSNSYELEQCSAASDKCNTKIKEVIRETQLVAFSTFQNAWLGFDDGCFARLVSGGRDYESVKNMLLVGLGQFIDVDNIVGIYGALSSDSMFKPV